jgi:acetyl-CoA acyltransferase
MPTAWTVSLGEATEQLAERDNVSRKEQDAFAARSHQRAQRAWDRGFYDAQVVTVTGVDLTRDESIRPDTSEETLSALNRSSGPTAP